MKVFKRSAKGDEAVLANEERVITLTGIFELEFAKRDLNSITKLLPLLSHLGTEGVFPFKTSDLARVPTQPVRSKDYRATVKVEQIGGTGVLGSQFDKDLIVRSGRHAEQIGPRRLSESTRDEQRQCQHCRDECNVQTSHVQPSSRFGCKAP